MFQGLSVPRALVVGSSAVHRAVVQLARRVLGNSCPVGQVRYGSRGYCAHAGSRGNLHAVVSITAPRRDAAGPAVAGVVAAAVGPLLQQRGRALWRSERHGRMAVLVAGNRPRLPEEMSIMNRHLAVVRIRVTHGWWILVYAMRFLNFTILSHNLVDALLDLVSGRPFKRVGSQHLSHDVEDRGIAPENIGPIIARDLFGCVLGQARHPALHLIKVFVKRGIKNGASSPCLLVFGGPEAGKLATGALQEVGEELKNDAAKRKDVGLLARAGSSLRSIHPPKLTRSAFRSGGQGGQD